MHGPNRLKSRLCGVECLGFRISEIQKIFVVNDAGQCRVKALTAGNGLGSRIQGLWCFGFRTTGLGFRCFWVKFMIRGA